MSLAVILFHFGTEGALERRGAFPPPIFLPMSAQVQAHIALSPTEDLLLNPLPVFHCFGLSVGTILPLVAGIKVVSHPTPLQPKEIVKRIKDHGITILLVDRHLYRPICTRGRAGDLDTVRLAVCGAERGAQRNPRPREGKIRHPDPEGYGVTEASPVIAANQAEANHPGTVGRMMAGMEAMLEPVEGIPGAGPSEGERPQCDAGLYPSRQPGRDRAARGRLA